MILCVYIYILEYIIGYIHIYIYIHTHDHPSNKPCRIDDLGVRFYSGQVGGPGFPIELYLSCDQLVWGKNLSKSETNFGRVFIL